MRFFVTLLLAIALTGCVSKYRLDSYAAPTSRIDRSASFYVPLPADGRYSATTYAGSGTATAQAVSNALLVHVKNVVIGTTAGEDLESAIEQAKQKNLTHVIRTTILNWEDRATQWSGIPDKITLKFDIYETQSGKEISSSMASASSKWATFGGDHPQDLLPEPAKRFVDPLF